jgi:hypothetical protein
MKVRLVLAVILGMIMATCVIYFIKLYREPVIPLENPPRVMRPECFKGRGIPTPEVK